MKKPYCVNCCKEVDFVVKEETLSSKIKGKIVKFKGKSAYCIDCGEYVFVDEIEDANIILARNQFFIGMNKRRKNKEEE